MRRPYVFVSYSRKDTLYVDRVLAALRAHRIPAWIDRHTRAPARWASEIRDRLDCSAAVLVVESSASRRSQWVTKEVDRAMNAELPVHALLLDHQESKFDGAVCYPVICPNGDPPPNIFKQLRVATENRTNRGICVGATGSFFAGMDLHGVDLRADNLNGADLRGTNLTGAVLIAANLAQADLTGANLSNADLIGCDLTGVSFEAAVVRSANFSFSKLTSAAFGETSLSTNCYRVCNFDNADFSGLKTQLPRRSPLQVLRAIWWRLRLLATCLTIRSTGVAVEREI